MFQPFCCVQLCLICNTVDPCNVVVKRALMRPDMGQMHGNELLGDSKTEMQKYLNTDTCACAMESISETFEIHFVLRIYYYIIGKRKENHIETSLLALVYYSYTILTNLLSIN